MDRFEFSEQTLKEIVKNLRYEDELSDVLCKRIWGGFCNPGFHIENRDQAVAFVIEKLRGIYSRS